MSFNFDITNKHEIFSYLISPGVNVNGAYTTERGFKNNFYDVYKEFKNYKWNNIIDNLPFSQKLWFFLQGINKPIHCKYCKSKLTKFVNFKIGFQKYCCMSCMNKDDEHKQNISNTINTKYESKEEFYKIRNSKTEKTCMEKYSTKNGGGTKESIEKGKNTKINNFGSLEECYRQSCEKQKRNLIQKYGSLKIAYENIGKKSLESILNKNNGIYPKQQSQLIEKIKKAKRNKFINNLLLNDKNIISISNDNILTCKCSETDCNLCQEKIFQIPYYLYYQRVKANLQLCYKKYNRKQKYSKCVSKFEKELFNFVMSIYTGKCLENDRNLLDGKEIDIYIPDLKIGFEFNGDFWHCNPELYDENFINPRSHKTFYELQELTQQKINIAHDKGVDLFIIWENDWKNKNEETKNKIKEIIDERNRRKI